MKENENYLRRQQQMHRGPDAWNDYNDQQYLQRRQLNIEELAAIPFNSDEEEEIAIAGEQAVE